MVKTVRFLSYLIFFILTLVYLLPKENLYYFLEKEIKTYNVIVSDEELIDRGFTLEIDNAKIYTESIKSADIKEIEISSYLIFNKIDIKKLYLSDALSSMLPTKINNINIIYSILDPINIRLNAVGEFGKASARFNLFDRKIYLKLYPSRLMKDEYQSTLYNFKKQASGEYEYVKSI